MKTRFHLLPVVVTLVLLGPSSWLQAQGTNQQGQETGRGKQNLPLTSGLNDQITAAVTKILANVTISVAQNLVNTGYTQTQAVQAATKAVQDKVSAVIAKTLSAFQGIDVKATGIYTYSTTDATNGSWSSPDMKTASKLHKIKGVVETEVSAVFKGTLKVEIEIDIDYEYAAIRFNGTPTGPSATVTADVSRSVDTELDITAGAGIQVTGGVDVQSDADLGNQSITIKPSR